MMVLLVATLNMAAQEEEVMMRGRIENVTDYSSMPSLAREGLRKVGSLAAAPLTNMGSPRVPVILVQFPDRPFTVRETEEDVHQVYHEHFNASEGVCPGTSRWSVREFFRMQSDEQFTPDFDVIGPVTLSKSYTYYGQDQGKSRDIHIQEFYREACQQAILHDVDWSLYDNDKNGVVDFVFFIYAGQGQNQEGTENTAIWPKESVSRFTVTGDGFNVSFGASGCTCELYLKEMDGIGACIHELSHGLGLPDFYDYNYKGYGMDYWDLMDSGCYKLHGRQPIGFSAYELEFLGWRQMVELTPDSAYSLTIDPLEKGGVAYKVVNKANPDEYFILENRQDIGVDNYMGYIVYSQYTTHGPNHGLMITHVNYSKSAWESNTVNTIDPSRQRFTIVPADGELIPAFERSDDVWAESAHGDLYPGPNNVTEISSYAVFKGGTLGQTIDNIEEHKDGTITLDINGGKPIIEPEDPNVEPDIPEIA